MITDLRLGLRSLTRAPGFFLLASLTLALGIGATTLMFSITESVLWRPLPVADSERLVHLSEFNPQVNPSGSPASAADFLDWRAQARSFEGLGAITWDVASHTLTGAGERVRSLAVSAGFFESLRVTPARGRTFRRAEENAAAHVAILTYDFWRTHFEAAPDILGRTFRIDGERYAIVGVMPAAFQLESILGIPDPSFFTPLDFTTASAHRGNRELDIIGRLGKGVSIPEATAEMKSLARSLAAEYSKEDSGWDVRVENLRESFTQFNRTVLYLFLSFAAFVLLIAAANVAGLQLVRAVGRQREYAVRVALGAGRAALLRQAMAEALWLLMPSGVLGALLAAWGVEAIRVLMPPGFLTRAAQISIDPQALAFVLLVCIAITVLFATIPALLSRGQRLEGALRAGARSLTAAPATQRLLNLLIASEMALSFVLLFGAGLFLTTNSRLKEVALGFDPHGIFTARITAGAASGYGAFYEEVMRRAGQTGGVREVALASAPPLNGGDWVPYSVAGREDAADGGQAHSLVRIITPGYFKLLRIPLLAGRALADIDSETAHRVAIVNENLAKRAFPGQNPIGRLLNILPNGYSDVPSGPVEIVGLAANVRELGLDEVRFDDIYLPLAQNPRRTLSLLARFTGRPAGLADSLRKDVQKLDPDSALYDARTFDEILARQFRNERFRMMLVSIFAALAILLASVGIYGAIAFSVAQRTREFALRTALGAMPAAIRRLTLSRTASLTVAGATCGLAIALVLGRLLGNALYLVPGRHGGVLFGVGIHDPLMLFTAGATVLAFALCASLIPATRAASVEPASELHHE